MENKPYQFYESANSYSYTSVAHDYELPELPRVRQTKHTQKKEQLKKAVVFRLLVYIMSGFLVFGGILAASVLYKGETDILQKNEEKLSRLQNDNIRYQTELSRKMAPETIRQIASEELGMSYLKNEPIYIRVKQGEEIIVYK